MSARHLDQAAYAASGGAPRPDRIRIVHLGLGNFHRAHQAWYTSRAADASDWGIAAFTGRSPRQSELLDEQDGLYTLVVRSAQNDAVEIVPSIVEAHSGADLRHLADLLSDPDVAIVTLTITEGGYRLTRSGEPDLSDGAVAADAIALAALLAEDEPDLEGAVIRTALGRLLVGLDLRRRADAGALAIVPCDNIPDNGEVVRRGLVAFAERVSPRLAAWIERSASFVSSSVDRITPQIDGDVPAVADAGWIDQLPVVTEPFSDWVLSGVFPAGRPAWETAGARFVDDLEPWENRKLWLLNGAHSILALAGLCRGLQTVSEAIDDPFCARLVDAFWAEAVALLPEGVEHEQYRRDLRERFRNPRIVHRLAQIAGDSTTKVRYRFVAVAERTLEAGGTPSASAAAIAVWISALAAGVVPDDAGSEELTRGLVAHDPVAALLAVISPRLAADPSFRALVAADALTPVPVRAELSSEGHHK